MTEVLLAASDLPVEADLVRLAPRHGMHVARRCVDAVALLAAAAHAPTTTVVVSAGLPRLTSDAVHRMAATRTVLGLAADDGAGDRLRALGVATVVRVGPTPDATMQALMEAENAVPPIAGVWGTGLFSEPATPAVPADPATGRIVAVWGPMGAPGRTTVAIGVAEALCEAGHRVGLVDADTYAPSITMALGIVEEASGLVVACRYADAGTISPSALARAAQPVRGGWSVVGGLAAAQHWTDLRSSGLERVWETCRVVFDVTVVDVGFCLEDDESDGAWARRRNASALTAVACADHTVAVADASGGGAARLVAAWPDLTVAAGADNVTVVRNRAQGGGRAWAGAIRGAGITAAVADVPLDPRTLERCWVQGRTLGEGARRSRLRSALGEVAARTVSG